MIHTLKLVLFITFLAISLLPDKIFGKNKKIWKIVLAILMAATALSFILFENQIQTTSALPCRTQVQPAASFLVCSLIFIEYKIQDLY